MTGMEHAIEHATERAERVLAPHFRNVALGGVEDDTHLGALVLRAVDALAEAGLIAPAPLREEALADEPEPWRCPDCNSDRWIRASLTRGLTVITQCVPCGRYVNCPPPDRADADRRADQ